MKVVAIINHKGGVGKTTLTANLGAGLAARGQRVLLIDLDSQASLTVSFFTQNEWTEELLPAKTIKHWYDGLADGDAMEDPTALLSSPPRVLGKLRRSSGHLDLIAAHRDLADVETRLAAQLLSAPGHFARVAQQVAQCARPQVAGRVRHRPHRLRTQLRVDREERRRCERTCC